MHVCPDADEPRTDQTLTFEQFLNFVLTYQSLGRDFHPYCGYTLDFALRVKATMKKKGAVGIATVTALLQTGGMSSTFHTILFVCFLGGSPGFVRLLQAALDPKNEKNNEN